MSDRRTDKQEILDILKILTAEEMAKVLASVKSVRNNRKQQFKSTVNKNLEYNSKELTSEDLTLDRRDNKQETLDILRTLTAEEMAEVLSNVRSIIDDRPANRKQKLRNIINGKIEYNPEELTSEDLDTALELFLENSRIEIPFEIRDNLKFKKKVIEYAKNNPKHAGMEYLFLAESYGILDKSFLDDKEFMEKVALKYYGKDASETITSRIYDEIGLENPDVLEQEITYIEKKVRETGDLGFLLGIMPYISSEKLQDLEFVDRIFSISTDEKVLGKLMMNNTKGESPLRNPDFSEKILTATREPSIIKSILGKMDKEDLTNPETMLKLVKVCPDVLSVFEENYNSYEDKYGNYRSNLFKELTRNENFQKGLFDMCQRLVQKSQIEEHCFKGHYIGRGTYRKYIPPSYSYHFKPDSPMAEFEGNMSDNTEKLVIDIIGSYYQKQQEQLENPQFNSSEISDIGDAANKNGFAYAVKKAEEIIKRRKEKPEVSTEALGVLAAENTNENRIEKTTIEIKEASTPDRSVNENSINEPGEQ